MIAWLFILASSALINNPSTLHPMYTIRQSYWLSAINSHYTLMDERGDVLPNISPILFPRVSKHQLRSMGYFIFMHGGGSCWCNTICKNCVTYFYKKFTAKTAINFIFIFHAFIMFTKSYNMQYNMNIRAVY